MRIDGQTRMAAVLANPIKHSLSPFIHNLAFEKTSINAVYLAWEVAKADVADSLANIKRYDMLGMNVSMPYKQLVLPYLDELSPEAQLIGAVNTLVPRDGRLIGHNTDGWGFFQSLRQTKSFEIKGQKMVLLGGGATATALMVQAILDGVQDIVVFNQVSYLDRTSQKLDHIMAKTGASIQLYDLSEKTLWQEHLTDADLLVNATSMGMDGKTNPLPIGLGLPRQLLVADVIYQPLETPFLAQARQEGLETINGLGMLVYQAAKAFQLWTGKDMPVDLVIAELSREIAKGVAS